MMLIITAPTGVASWAIDAMQGYGLCRPLPFAAMTAYLQEMRDRPR